MNPARALVATLALLLGLTGFAQAQPPAASGIVAQYSLTPHGDVDGLILADGTEIHLPPHLGPQLVAAVRPGESVTVRGLRARAIPAVQALSITNDATGRAVSDTGTPAPIPTQAQDQQRRDMLVQGTVKARLHGPRGDVNGVLLTDGTIIRMPPPEAARLAGQMAPGTTVAVGGSGTAGPLGRAIDATRIGPDPSRLSPLQTRPRPPTKSLP